MIPNLEPLTVHASGYVAGATGVVTNPVNVAGVVRTGAGAYTITLGSQIDLTHRFVAITPTATDGVLEHVIAGDTDVLILVASDANATPGVPADVDFSFIVFRTVKLG